MLIIDWVIYQVQFNVLDFNLHSGSVISSCINWLLKPNVYWKKIKYIICLLREVVASTVQQAMETLSYILYDVVMVVYSHTKTRQISSVTLFCLLAWLRSVHGLNWKLNTSIVKSILYTNLLTVNEHDNVVQGISHLAWYEKYFWIRLLIINIYTWLHMNTILNILFRNFMLTRQRIINNTICLLMLYV